MLSPGQETIKAAQEASDMLKQVNEGTGQKLMYYCVFRTHCGTGLLQQERPRLLLPKRWQQVARRKSEQPGILLHSYWSCTFRLLCPRGFLAVQSSCIAIGVPLHGLVQGHTVTVFLNASLVGPYSHTCTRVSRPYSVRCNELANGSLLSPL